MDDRHHPQQQRPFASDELQTLAVPVPGPGSDEAAAAGIDWNAIDKKGESSSMTGSEEEDSQESGDDTRRRHKNRRKRRRSKRSTEAPATPVPPQGGRSRNWETTPAIFMTLLALSTVVAAGLYAHLQLDSAVRVPLAPLWLTTHDTHSTPLDIHAALARPLVAYLSDAFDAHLHARYYPCLCMHHVNPGAVSNTLYQVCGTTQIRGPLVNPVLTGRGNETDYWTESSIACATLERGQRRARYRTIWLQWHDVATGQQMFGRFDGAVAACMQLAMDEMNMGNKVCN